MDNDELEALAVRVEAADRGDNTLDVLCEVALFEPINNAISVRPNAAGTKVIYTHACGKEVTCGAPDLTIDREARLETAAALRAMKGQADE